MAGSYSTKNEQCGIDGLGNIAAVWQVFDGDGGSYIQGSYGSSFPAVPTNITDPKLNKASNPMIVTSTSTHATTKAAAVWLATDLTTKNEIIQATILTPLGWNTSPVTLSHNDGSELPSKKYKITISDDGMLIFVTWASSFPSALESYVCCSVSTNGGLTWSKGDKLAQDPS